MNTYTYVAGNPLSYVDPTGLLLFAVPPVVTTTVNLVGAIVVLATAPNPFEPELQLGIDAGALVGTAIGSALTAPALPGEQLGDTQCRNDDDDECDRIYGEETDRCWRDYGSVFGRSSWQFSGCMKRARDRHSLCIRNGGKMPPYAPPPWSDRDIDGWPTIH